ncbi:unnamed protein product [Thlaspi arvense]|uniref:PWWP domain-containing protein n=1 Tax=Thlaspi arvense TaxID=13288 RepID=A0AAU9T6R6_THLAR|nr:unnamed protein product [Thlaspi arvense]
MGFAARKVASTRTFFFSLNMEMEVVLGIGEEARPKACTSEIGSAKRQDGSGEDSTQENGVRVSENGAGDDDDNKSKDNVVVETENLNGSGVVEDRVMNGVSSLLKLKQDVNKDDNLQEEKEIAGDEAKAEEDEEGEEEEHGYNVGDFVWGKIKNHPWWPGQIYDPSEASDLALKIKQKGKLLVAYFGDCSFAWCGPSQLKPFAESFKDCSNVSNSRGFLSAVEEAVEEMGRHVERLLLCDCGEEEEKEKLDNRKVKNAGIKEGVAVRDVRREMISSLLVGKPEGILEDVKGFAESASFSGLLELEILKRKVSAFYRSKRGYGLTEYHEPQSVPGLEDKNDDDDDDDDDEDEEEKIDDGIKRLSKGKEEEEEGALGPQGSLQRSLEKCSGFPDHRLQHRRKQKSIAEILENESGAKVRFETEAEDGNVKSSRRKVKRHDEVNGELATVSTTKPRRRRMSEVSTVEDDGGGNQVEENSEGKTVSRKRKKKDEDDDGSGDREESEKENLDDETDNDSTPLASLRKKVRFAASSAGDGEISVQTTKRERKKSKYLSPEYLSDFSSKRKKKSNIEPESPKVLTQSQESQVEEQMTNASDSLVAVEVEEEDKVDSPSLLENGIGHQELSEELSNAVDFLRLGATPEEIRDLIRVSALGTQYPKDSSSEDMVREFMSIYRSFTYHEGANRKFLGSYKSSETDKEELNGTGKAETSGKESRKYKKRKAKEQTEEVEQIGKEENETDKKERKPKSKKQAGEEEETRKESSETAKKERKRKKPESKKQTDEEEETLKESIESTKKERKKRKKSESKKLADEEEETVKESKESKESKKKERKAKKRKDEEEELRNETEKSEKKEKKKREGKSKKQEVDKRKIETEKEFSGAELLVTFGPGSSLPKKEDLIETYKKFGALDEERTDMFDTNFYARVTFLNIADGERAFESSQEKCPFTSTSTVKFRLKYPNERTEEKKAEAEIAETTMDMEYVKKKLEEMRSLVDGVMTEEAKVKLEDEMVNLLEKVRSMRSS